MRNQLTHFCGRCIGYGTFTRLDSKSGAETLEICDGTVSKLIQAGKDV
jgi:hypothetical protein